MSDAPVKSESLPFYWVLIAACCVLSGVRGQYGAERGHYGPPLAFSPAASFAGPANPYAAHAAAAALTAGAGAPQLTLAPAAAVFGPVQQQQFAAAPGFSPAFLGGGYGAQAPSQLIVSPVLHQEGVAGLVPAGTPNFGRTTVTHYGGGGSSQITRFQPATYTANNGAAASGATTRTQYQSTQLQAAPGTSSTTLYREPKQLPSLSSLSQLQSAGAPAGSTVTVQEVGQTQLGALQNYGGAGTAGLFSGYGAAAAYPSPRTAGYGYGAGLRAY
ncbi:hypothetical protein HPB50_010591 [Hyalomma asiaticum]|uniref:Uncharacterized protein n=1 Tax=Hyalomma asiaticum TaxID=266040 RepID=A0ACB7S262_HYAAI|nr:hypothetical protein HPB50_010591 [Hyalomma asiaticum]